MDSLLYKWTKCIHFQRHSLMSKMVFTDTGYIESSDGGLCLWYIHIHCLGFVFFTKQFPCCRELFLASVLCNACRCSFSSINSASLCLQWIIACASWVMLTFFHMLIRFYNIFWGIQRASGLSPSAITIVIITEGSTLWVIRCFSW